MRERERERERESSALLRSERIKVRKNASDDDRSDLVKTFLSYLILRTKSTSTNHKLLRTSKN